MHAYKRASTHTNTHTHTHTYTYTCMRVQKTWTMSERSRSSASAASDLSNMIQTCVGVPTHPSAPQHMTHIHTHNDKTHASSLHACIHTNTHPIAIERLRQRRPGTREQVYPQQMLRACCLRRVDPPPHLAGSSASQGSAMSFHQQALQVVELAAVCMHVCTYACMHACMHGMLVGCMCVCVCVCKQAWTHACTAYFRIQILVKLACTRPEKRKKARTHTNGRQT